MEESNITGFSWELALDGKHFLPIVSLRGDAFKMAHFTTSKIEFLASAIKRSIEFKSLKSRFILYINDLAVEVTKVNSNNVELKLDNKYVNTNDLPIQRKLYNSLTAQEKKVLTLVDNGLTRTEIADELFISVSTVSEYKQNILKKLNLESKTQLLRWCFEYLSHFQ